MLLDLDRILARLRARDEQLVTVFECRFFGGFSEAETAEALGLSLRSVQRAFMRARAWLRTELGTAAEEPPGD
jgi:DNA-directed RNA polymerase specialized sigma24 family protein